MTGLPDLATTKVKRQSLISLIWPQGLPVIQPDYYIGLRDNRWPSLKQIDRMNYTLSHGFKGSSSAFIPLTWNGRLILYQEGHNPSFWSGQKYIQHFVDKGFIVCAFSMPTYDPNNKPVVSTAYGNVTMSDHKAMSILPSPAVLSIFLEPVVQVLNRIAGFYQDITMIGYSGGGWTTGLCAALDERITYSFPVAGSLPWWMRFLPPNDTNSTVGDFEQYTPEFFGHADWTTLHALATTPSAKGPRAQMQVLNQFDPCCFAGINYQSYEGAVSQLASLWGGKFSVWLDAENREHSISDAALAAIDARLNI